MTKEANSEPHKTLAVPELNVKKNKHHQQQLQKTTLRPVLL